MNIVVTGKRVSKEEFEEHIRMFPRVKRSGFSGGHEYYHIWKGKHERVGVLTDDKEYYIEVRDPIIEEKKQTGYTYECLVLNCQKMFTSGEPLDANNQYCPRCSMEIQRQLKFYAENPDLDPSNPWNSNGFLKEFDRIENAEDRIRETIRYWLMIHYGNTGPTDSNINKLARELMRILNSLDGTK